MKINANNMIMTVYGTTFQDNNVAGYGGAFYVSSLQELTLSSNTANYFSAPSGGRFLYYSGTTSLTLNVPSSYFRCNYYGYTTNTVRN
jgi:predicted outer membrane repeat protein